MTSLFSIILVNIGNVLGAIGALFFKQASSNLSLKNFYKNKKLISGLIIYISSAVLFVIALKNGELTILYPMVASVYVWVVLFSIWILKEKMNMWKWLGIIAILIGVSLVGIG